MSDSGSSWAPFGPSPDDDEEPRAKETPEPEPEPAAESEPEPPPAAFAPPTPAEPKPLPAPTPQSPLAWPDPAPRAPQPAASEPPPSSQQAPWPPQEFQGRKPVPSDATVALVVGIASVLFCGFIGPFAIFYGLRARRQIDADPALGGRGLATWGYALGIVSTTVLIILLALVAAGVIVLSR